MIKRVALRIVGKISAWALGKYVQAQAKRASDKILGEQVERIHNTPYVWTALATGGGGKFITGPLVRADAIKMVASTGNKVIYVDDEYHFIFYKAI